MKKCFFLASFLLLLFLVGCNKEIEYEITFETNGGTTIETITSIEDIQTGLPQTTKDGYTFDGWFFDSAFTLPFDIQDIDEPIFTLYAKWTLIVVDYHVDTYIENLDGDFVLLEHQTFEDVPNKLITITPEPISGFTFDDDHDDNLTSTNISSDGTTTFLLYYTRDTYTITFISNASLSIQSISTKYEAPITEPNVPIRLGYTFVDWYIDEDLTIVYEFDTMPSEDITLYAKWMGEITTLYFNTYGGNSIEPIVAPLGSEIDAPETPQKDGYDFVGWYLESNYQTSYTNWVMPQGGITLHAKWTEKTYTITFQTNGGTSIDPLGVKYNFNITLPSAPTKEEFVFGGWFNDADLLDPFTLDQMPMSNITLYAKWLDAADTSTISYQSSLDRYDEVTIRGVVNAILEDPYQGYILYDSTGSIIIYDDEVVSIGDDLTVIGSLYHQNQIPTVINVTSTTVENTDEPTMTQAIKSIDELNQYEFNISNFGKTFETSGILSYQNGNYYLVSQSTYSKILLTNHFNFSAFETLNNQKISATLIFMNHSDTWQVGLLTYTSTPYTDEEIITDTKAYLLSLYNEEYYAFETLDFPTTDPLGLTTIDISLLSGHEAYYSFDTKQLSDTTNQRTVSFNADIQINTTTSQQQIDMVVNPIDFMTIANFKALSTSELGAISGTIIFKADTEFIYGVYDGFETIYLFTETYLEVGDFVWIIAHKDYIESMPIITDETTRLLLIKSNENPISYPTITMDDQTFLDLDLDDPSIYGQKVELQGFVHEMMDGHAYQLELDDKTITIEPISHAAFEDLFDFVGLEVNIKGYVTILFDGTLGLYIEGIRQDYEIPDYTASQRVDMIVTLFSRAYATKEFTSFESFTLYPYHPVLGGTITYQFIEGEEYYDEVNKQFIFVESPVTIKLQLTITKDDVTKTYLYQTILNPVHITTIEDLEFVEYYGYAYIKGIIIYRSPYLAYIMDDTGITKLRVRDLNCYVGDEVIVYGQISVSNYDYGQISMSQADYDDPVIAILSRGNDFTVPMLEGFEALNAFDPETTEPYNQLISLSGTIGGTFGNFYITDGSSKVYVEPEYNVVLYKLEKLIGLSVTLEGIIVDYDGYYELFYAGIEGDLSVNDYSDQDKLDYISGALTNLTDDPIAGGTTFLLPSTDEQFNATITYQMDTAYDTYYDLEYGSVSYVDDITNIPVTATIYLSDTLYLEVSLTLTILPATSYEQILISEFLTRPVDTYKLQAKIIAITTYDGSFGFIIQDESGKIFVPLKNVYYSNSIYVGRPITVYGKLGFNDGRPEVLDAQITISSYSTSVETEFIETEISEVIQYNLFDPSVYGKPLLLEGEIIRIDYFTYAITDGKHMLKINSVYQSINNLERYAGLNAILKVFFIGDLDDDGIYDVVINNAFYGGTATMMYAEYSDLEFADIIYNDLIKTFNFRAYKAYEEIYLANYHSFYPSALITYELISDPLAATLIGSDLQFNPMTTDQEVIVQMTIVYKSATVVYDIAFNLKHADIKDFADLFEAFPELDEMGIRGQMVYYNWKFVYVLIEGDIYYLEGYFNGGYEYGESILIYGKKSTVEGSTAYTYDIEILNTHLYDPINLPPSYTSLEDLDLNNMDPNYLKQVLTLYGLLRYDEYLGWYYIEPTNPNSGIRIYLRADIRDEEAWSYSIFRTRDSYSKYIMDEYLNLPVYMDVLNPGIRMVGDYVMVDLVPSVADLRLEEMTPQQKIDYGKDYIDRINETLVFYPGDYLYENLPYYQDVLGLSYHYEFDDPLDIMYGNITSGDTFKSITEPTTITIEATISYYDYDEDIEYSDTHLLDIIVMPISMSSIDDVLWGITDQVYKVTGTIIYLNPDNYMLISDGEDIIYVDTYYLSDDFDVDLALYDTVVLTATRDYYEFGHIPMLLDVIDIIEIAPQSVTAPTPVEMTLDDILNINFLVPSAFNERITYTGTLIYVGTSYYEYRIRFEGQDDNLYDLTLRPNMDPFDFDDLMSPYIGQEITVTGYLSIFEFLSDPFDWYLLYESFE